MKTAAGPAPKSMTFQEVQEVARELDTWVGAQLQEVVIDGIKGEDPRSLRLGFFWTGGIRWIVFDYRIQAPLLMLFDGHEGVPRTPPKTAGKIRRPIELFLRSKHIGRRLREIRRHRDDGRALDLVFDPADDGSEVAIEMKVFPHGRNVRAISGAQSVTEFKPMPPSKASTSSDSTRAEALDRSSRDFQRSPQQIAFEWLRFVAPDKFGENENTSMVEPRSQVTSSTAKSPLAIKIEKIRKALTKVQDEIASKEQSPAREIGEWVKSNQTLRVPSEWPASWREMIDPKKSLSSNIEKLFTTAKSQARKLDGTRARASELRAELQVLERKQARGELQEESNQSRGEALEGATKDLFEAARAHGRKFQLAPDLIVYLGKNAAENLAILRKAQPFDYWLHLRDRPGAHAILRRPRGRNITDSELIKAGTYVAEQTMKRRAIDLRGEAFDLLIVECRFVRPIKGDRLGRVHYTNDRVLRFSL